MSKLRIFMGTILTCGLLASVKVNPEKLILREEIPSYSDSFDSKRNPLYASFTFGDIYITTNTRNLLNSERDIVILDFRDINSDIKILNSYHITDKEIQEKVVDVILDYNERFPSKIPWERTKESLLHEWFFHNLAYFLNYRVDHTADVDFQTEEEETYKMKLYK